MENRKIIEQLVRELEIKISDSNNMCPVSTSFEYTDGKINKIVILALNFKEEAKTKWNGFINVLVVKRKPFL